MAIEDVKITEDDEIEVTLKDDESEDGSEESTETPDPSLSDEGETVEEKAEEETEESEIEESKSGEEDQEEPKYQGKSREQIIQMHGEAEKKIGEQGKELGKVRVEKKDIEDKEIVEKMSLQELHSANKQLRVKMAKLDPEYDKVEYDNLAEAIAQAEQDILDKRHTTMINEQLTSKENQDFVEKQKPVLKERGFFVNESGEFNDDEFQAVVEQSKNYSENGRLTENSVFKAMIDLHGIDKINKVLEINTELSTRQKIKTAADKIDNKIDSRGKGSETDSRKVVRLSRMTPFEREKFMDGLSVEELDVLQSAVEKRVKK